MELSPRALRIVLLSNDLVIQAFCATSIWTPLSHAQAASISYRESLSLKESVERMKFQGPEDASVIEAQKCIELADKLFDHAILLLYYFLKEVNDDGCGKCPHCQFRAKVEAMDRQNASQN